MENHSVGKACEERGGGEMEGGEPSFLCGEVYVGQKNFSLFITFTQHKKTTEAPSSVLVTIVYRRTDLRWSMISREMD